MDRGKMRKRTLYLTQLALLAALIFVLQYIGNFIGETGLNLTLIPIVVGAALLGPIGGLILGLICGAVTLMTPLAQAIMGYSPVAAILICFGKTGLAGFAAGWLYRWIAKKNRHIGIITASVATPVINTGVFVVGCSCIVDFFVKTPDAFGPVAEGTSAWGFIVFVGSVIAINFLIEFTVNAVASTAVYQIVSVVEKRFQK